MKLREMQFKDADGVMRPWFTIRPMTDEYGGGFEVVDVRHDLQVSVLKTLEEAEAFLDNLMWLTPFQVHPIKAQSPQN